MKASPKNWTPGQVNALLGILLTAGVTAYGTYATKSYIDFNAAVEIYNSTQKDRGPLEYWARDTVIAYTGIASVPNLYAVKDLHAEELIY